ncbi:MAG: hypothetical protein K1X88_15670 [Nannocystaceae bacterium]|nr:hypothetical protein [Nannocystaceae bacterium]
MVSRPALLLLALTTSLAAAPQVQADPSVRLHVQVPFDTNPAATNLDFVESHGTTPYLSRSFEVPYAAIEKQIEKKLEDAIDSPLVGELDLPDPAGMMSYRIKIDPTVKFLQKKQPSFTKVGPSSDATFDVKLDTRVRVNVHVDVHVESGPASADIPIDAFVVVNASGKVRLKLWPTISAESVDVEFSVQDSNLDLELNGTAMELGAAAGALVGLSPAGVFGGGLLLGPIGAIVANAAADYAEKKLSEKFSAELEKLVPKYGDEVENFLKKELDPQLAAADAVKDKILDKQIPGTGKSLEQLMALLGASFEVHVATPADSLAVAATLRMSGAAGSGALHGKIRVPKQKCTYVEGSDNGWLAGAKLPMGMTPTNVDLAKQVGKACSAVLSTSGLQHEIYLGGNPRKVLGDEAEVRTTWRSGGSVELVGKLTDHPDYYECAFTVDELPNAAIFDLESSGALAGRLGEEQFDERMLLLAAGGGATLVLDHRLTPWDAGGVVVGGPGQCHGHGGGAKPLTPSQLAELLERFDPESCPNCGIERIPGTSDWRVTDMAAFEKSAIGSKLKGSLSKIPGAVKAGAIR